MYSHISRIIPRGPYSQDLSALDLALVPVVKYRILGRYMGGCKNYGLFLDTLNIRCRIIKGTIILTTTLLIIWYLDP